MDDNDQVLVVEGQDERHVVWHLSNLHQEMPEFCILNKEGIDNLLEDIGAEIRAPNRKVVGILLDANDDLYARWSAVSNRLREEEIEVPESPEAGGTILDGTPRIGIWLMPDNTSSGELEDFVSKMIPDDDPVWPLSQGYIDGIPVAHRKFTGKKIQRAKPPCLAGNQGGIPDRWLPPLVAGDLQVDGQLSTTFARLAAEAVQLIR